MSAGPEQRALEQLLRYLFPNVEQAYSGVEQGWDQERMRRERRIAHPDIFPRYFAMAIPAGDMSDAETEEVLRWGPRAPTRCLSVCAA